MKSKVQRTILPVVFALSLFLTASQIFAQGGFQGPSIQENTVEQALKMSDDAHVTLRGQIVQSLGDERYLFRDATGSITVEIDDDDWRSLTVTPKDTVIISGEIDKEWFGRDIEVDVDSIRKADTGSTL